MAATRTRTRTATVPLEPTTDTGTGLLVPIAKAYGRIATLEAATHREWPLTQEQAAAELTETIAVNVNLMVPTPHVLFTEELNDALFNWKDQMNRESRAVLESSRETPEEPINDAQRDTIRDLMRSTWDLMARVDREITGIPAADPGRRP